MTATEFSLLSENFDALNQEQASALEKITYRYPYFQTAYALYLKSLKKQEKFNFNLILKKTAVISPERSKLYEWLEREQVIQKTEEPRAEDKEKSPVIIEAKIEETVKKDMEDTQESSKETSNIEEDVVVETKKKTTIEVEKEITKEEVKTPKEELPANLSFIEWIEWIKSNNAEALQELDSKSSFEDKVELIDTFLKNNPKIPPVSANTAKQNLSKEIIFDKEELMTETLAKVYVKQGKYKKALLSYKILSLKYPEKNSFFADQIKAIKDLQQK